MVCMAAKVVLCARSIVVFAATPQDAHGWLSEAVSGPFDRDGAVCLPVLNAVAETWATECAPDALVHPRWTVCARVPGWERVPPVVKAWCDWIIWAALEQCSLRDVTELTAIYGEAANDTA